VFASFPFPQELRKRLIGFANENDISQPLELFGLNGRHGTSNDREDATFTNFGKDFAQASPLDAHSGDAHHIRAGKTVEIDLLDFLVDESDVVALGNQRCEKRQASDWQVGALAKHMHFSMPQKETSKRGLMMTMSAMIASSISVGNRDN
jgi:hypothetical protein